ncbi:MAG: pseudouridine synthase [Promethearchaeota archaeon]|nr:MAG: pseudouridine synthase [Candidatus Lokiarchaeota archaeon]
MEINFDNQEFIYHLRKFYALLQYQYSIPKSNLKLINKPKTSFILSKNTNRLRFIKYQNNLIATFRSQDGNLVLTKEGAILIKELLPPPKMRVAILDEISDFIKRGRNLFVKHITKFDPELRPGSEVLVVNSNDELIAVGKIIMSKKDLITFKSGVAVKIR